MSLIKKIKNTSGGPKTYRGQVIANGAYYEIQPLEEKTFIIDAELVADIAAGNALINDGTTDLNVADSQEWLECENADCILGVHINDAAKADGYALKYDSASGKIIYGPAAAGATVAYLLNFGDKTGPGISTISGTYSAQGVFSYHGTSVTLGKSAAKVDSGATGKIRFYNVTAANVVMESDTFSNTSYATIDMGTVTNQPSEGDVIEVQYKRATGSGGSAIEMASATMFVDL